ncbi:hypothetical protein ECG_06781 [Echinococcus granulosus]|uniref:PUR alpha beta gamma DNA RNA binding n=1 Tax=Echinococcus granulosus TaxID=6210 RepID=A0A068WH95_ECHGR|nr:hypothetical protein ECG_06781 [Echinococcus granulosus]CDS19127.1 PUR alpha beta gamma DNA RNA binding [Echinococcus granulosus]
MSHQHGQLNYNCAPYGSPNKQGIHLRGIQRRMLMRELVVNKVSETKTVGYVMGVIQSPLKRSYAPNSQIRVQYDGLEHGDPDLAPWVVLRSRFTREEAVTFPISMCADLYNHLLHCAQLRQDELDSSGEAHTTQGSDQNDDENCAFDLSHLRSVAFIDEATNCSLTILTEQPTLGESKSGRESEFGKVRRWIQSGPLNKPEDKSANGPHTLPMHMRTVYLELYEILLPNLITFLSDICVRYQHLDQPPQLNFLYSPSGERRFFFDIRNTPYGNRLHISQVTDLHRNVIGIPLESLVTFRNRLTMLIDALKLEDGEVMRETLEKYSSRPRRLRFIRPTFGNQAATSSSSRQTRFENENKRVQQRNKLEETKAPVKTRRPPQQGGTAFKSQPKPQEPNTEGDHKADEVQGSANRNAKEENEVKQEEDRPMVRRNGKKKRSRVVNANQKEEKVAP